MQNFILVPDSFKGTLSAIEVCNIMKSSIKNLYKDANIISVPVADGGEGTVDAFLYALGGEKKSIWVSDAFNEQKILAHYAMLKDNIAVIEMAACAGLPLVKNRLEPDKTTTFGVGELIIDAINSGAKKIILGLGGSATNDGGCGMAVALGVKFKDEQDQEFIPTGGTLSQIYKIDMNNIYSKIKDVEFISMCDVDNPLCGRLGASAVFAPQKGADEDMVKSLDEGLAHLAKIIKRDLHIEVKDIKGAGAAGGLGAGSIAFLQSKLTKGIDVILDTINFDELVSKADIVFTGEGKFDSQSLHGKVVMGVANRSQKYKTPVIVVTGAIGENIQEAYNKGITAIFSINKEPMEFSKSALKSKENMILTMENILRLLKI
ncbi:MULTISPECIES: glycerate kinase [Megamonas]|jgi:glycerate kinase|uniref:Glycerate kinase n=1 Tax=Megamonas funiformis TaxID=437897 RepID=A0AAW4U5L1_9FIRM|nr:MULTISPECIES: glycerate kinase [Megamonas]MBS7211748.1 glycerate kinase [Megamonas funiformis]MCB6828528.1 glycerate kinase [Megamonas funiformis]